MLVLCRKPGEKVTIGGNVTLTVVEVKGSQVRLAFDAPVQVRILRSELGSDKNQPMSDEDLSDPDLAEKLQEWRDANLPFARPLPTARVVAMETHLPQQRADYPGDENVSSVANGLRILLVAEDVRTAEDMAQLLRHSGHQVRISPDVAAALQAAEKDDADVLLLESNGPGMQGQEAAAKLREWSPWKKPFCIVLAGEDAESGPPRPEEGGIDLRLARPVNGHLARGIAEVSARYYADHSRPG